jgi:N-acetylmuramoyl-L-alanine amidase
MKRLILLLPLLVLSCSLWTASAAIPPLSGGTLHAPSTTLTQVIEPTATPARSCTVTAPDALNLRSGPGTQYPVKAWLRSGDVLGIRSVAGAWLNVETGDGRTGWVHGSYCR